MWNIQPVALATWTEQTQALSIQCHSEKTIP